MNKKGFTLIELLIVIAIISILAGIVLVGLRPSLNTARDVRRAAELKQLQTVLTTYYARYGTYPADLAELANGVQFSGLPALGGSAFTYRYVQDSANNNYVIGVQFEDSVGDSLKAGAYTQSSPSPTDGSAPLDCSDPKVYCLSGF